LGSVIPTGAIHPLSAPLQALVESMPNREMAGSLKCPKLVAGAAGF
jgi:hypothetical protein